MLNARKIKPAIGTFVSVAACSQKSMGERTTLVLSHPMVHRDVIFGDIMSNLDGNSAHISMSLVVNQAD